MSNYKISKYSYEQAKKLQVEIKPSKKKDKKIDVYKDGELISSIGARGFADYSIYMRTKGKIYANERRRLYHLRHAKEKDKEFSPGWLSLKILW